MAMNMCLQISWPRVAEHCSIPHHLARTSLVSLLASCSHTLHHCSTLGSRSVWHSAYAVYDLRTIRMTTIHVTMAIISSTQNEGGATNLLTYRSCGFGPGSIMWTSILLRKWKSSLFCWRLGALIAWRCAILYNAGARCSTWPIVIKGTYIIKVGSALTGSLELV